MGHFTLSGDGTQAFGNAGRRESHSCHACYNGPMPYIIAGLGNPGEEYRGTRHNAGRIVLEAIRKEFSVDDFEFDRKLNALAAEAKIGKDKVLLVAPETFMNNSGKTVGRLIRNRKAAGKLMVIYDDFQLPLGRVKLSFNKSSGGHNGLESVIKAVKTMEFPRLRVGTAPADARGNAKVPHGDDKIERFILGPFKPDELKVLKKVAKKIVGVVELWVNEGRDRAANVANS